MDNEDFEGRKSYKIEDVKTLAAFVKQTRQTKEYTLVNLADECGVGSFFLLQLEKADPSVDFERILQVINHLGYEFILRKKEIDEWP